jgi:hypothetical protein
MEMGTLVALIQAGIWAIGLISLMVRIFRGDRQTPNWVFSNRFFVPVLVLGCLASAYSLYLNYRNRPISPDAWAGYKKEAIVGKTYTQERVILDGHSFVDCKFDKVTLVYNGTAPFAFTHNTLIPPINVASDNPAVLNTLSAAIEFERLNRQLGADEHGHIVPPVDQKK